MSDASPYTVGFGRPPAHSQFKAGQSGNPKGRPRGSKNLRTLLQEELDQKVPVIENGRQKLMTKRRIAVRQQVDKAVKGDQKAFDVLVKYDGDDGGAGRNRAEGPSPGSEIPAAAYDQVVAEFIKALTTDDGDPA